MATELSSRVLVQYGSNECFFFFSPLQGFLMELDAALNVPAPYGSMVLFCYLFFSFFSIFLKELCSSLSSEAVAVLFRITYTDALFVPFNQKNFM